MLSMSDRGLKYRKGVLKEQAALDLTESFFANVFGMSLSAVTDEEENYKRGDFTAPTAKYIEVKGQPIKPPYGYRGMNFVEVFEAPQPPKSHHVPFQRLCDILDISRTVLSLGPCGLKTGRQSSVSPMGCQYPSNASKLPASSVYCNNCLNEDGFWHLCVYRAVDLLGLIRGTVLRKGFDLGRGKSNDVTYGMQLPYPTNCWKTPDQKIWKWSHPGADESAAHRMIVNELSA